MTTVYLAARFSLRSWMQACAADLMADLGIETTSRWIDGHGDDKDDFTPAELAVFADEDIEDIRRADVFVTFTTHEGVGYTSGGRHVEFGIALILGKPIIIIGPRENVFHELAETSPQITHVETWAGAKAALVELRERAAA